MATEPEAKETDGRPGPLTPAGRKRPPAPPQTPGLSPPETPPPVSPRDPAFNLSDVLVGLVSGA